MTNEDIIRMAQEAGFSPLWLTSGGNPPHFEAPAVIVARFANLVAAAEREENAKLCNSLAKWHGQLVTAAFDHAADSIRYKGEQTSTNEMDERLRARSTYHGNNP